MSLGFTEEQVRRYSRHIILPGIGGEGQRKLLDSKALVIGAGGAGLRAAGASVATRHPVEVLDASYRAAGFYG